MSNWQSEMIDFLLNLFNSNMKGDDSLETSFFFNSMFNDVFLKYIIDWLSVSDLVLSLSNI